VASPDPGKEEPKVPIVHLRLPILKVPAMSKLLVVSILKTPANLPTHGVLKLLRVISPWNAISSVATLHRILFVVCFLALQHRRALATPRRVTMKATQEVAKVAKTAAATPATPTLPPAVPATPAARLPAPSVRGGTGSGRRGHEQSSGGRGDALVRTILSRRPICDATTSHVRPICDATIPHKLWYGSERATARTMWPWLPKVSYLFSVALFLQG